MLKLYHKILNVLLYVAAGWGVVPDEVDRVHEGLVLDPREEVFCKRTIFFKIYLSFDPEGFWGRKQLQGDWGAILPGKREPIPIPLLVPSDTPQVRADKADARPWLHIREKNSRIDWIQY